MKIVPLSKEEVLGHRLTKKEVERALKARYKHWLWKKKREETSRSIAELFIMEEVEPA